MAPKREQAAAVTPATVLIGLSSAEPTQQLQALNQLTIHATAFSQAEVLQCGIPTKLVGLLQQPDKSVKLLACRQLAMYAATAGPLQQATASLEAVQTIWAVLSAYCAAEAAIADALVDPVAAKAAQPKKQQAAKDIVEPDEWLPGPSKYLLDAAVRTLCSLLGSTTSAQIQQQTESADVTEEPTAAADAVQLDAWVAEQDVNVLVCLARHPSGRVQMRACRLAHQLAKAPSWADAFATAGGAAAAFTIGASSTPSNPALQLTALRLLHRLADVSIAAAAVMVAEPWQATDALILQMLEAGAAPSVQGKGKTTSSGAEAGKMVNFEVTSVQLAAADLLALLCCKSSSVGQHVVTSGGLAALQALLPEAPAPPLTAEEVAEKHRLNNSSEEADGTKSPRKPTNSKQPTPRPAGDTTRQTPPRTPVAPVGDAQQGTPRGATPAAGNTARCSPQTPHQSQSGSDSPAGGQDTTAATELSAPEEVIPMPAAKTAAPELQARVLYIIASIVQHQQLVKALLLQSTPGQASLLRLLLHVFAPIPVTEQPYVVAGEAADAALLAAEAAASGHAAAAAAAAARAPTPTKAAGSTIPAAKGTATAAGGRKSGVGAADAAGAAATAAAGAATPRKGAGTAAVGAAGKDGQKVEPVAVVDPLAPPYSTITKAAALDCLAHIVQDKQAVALLAAQQVPVPQATNQPSLVRQRDVSASEVAAAAGGGGASHDSNGNSADVTEWQAEAAVSMLQHMLEDLLVLGTAQESADAAHSITSSNTAVVASGQQPDSTKDSLAIAEVQHRPASTLDGAAAVLAGLAEHLDKQQLLELPMLPALKALAKCGVNQHTSLQAHQAVSRALLLLPEAAFVPAARPPLPSPPPTPPAPPLPTSQFAWDALDRPLITDGVVVLSSA